MRCWFQVALPGEAVVYLRAAADEALAEAARLERTLSRFEPTSEVSRINAGGSDYPVLVDHETFALLRHVRALALATDGAFDPTIGPVVDLWRAATPDAPPSAEAIAQALARVGVDRLVCDAQEPRVGFARPGMNLDLGGVGKGYAVGCIGRMLRDLEVTSALIDAGTSSALALGAPPGQAGWRVALADPRAVGAGDPEPEPHAFLGEVLLRDTALSVSGVRGGDRGGWAHVLDPRTGAPTQGVWQAVVVDPSPVVAEVLSTALLVAGERLLERLGERFPSAAALLLAGPEGRVLKTANWPGP